MWCSALVWRLLQQQEGRAEACQGPADWEPFGSGSAMLLGPARPILGASPTLRCHPTVRQLPMVDWPRAASRVPGGHTAAGSGPGGAAG